MDKHTRVLALSLRPRSLNELIGQDDIIKTIEQQFLSRRIPHFFILSGPVGCGKTTLARILAKKIHLLYCDLKNVKHHEIREINAANQTGIDDIRKLIDHMTFKPLPPSKAKVVILDEAHQLSTPAQNALITETEDVADHVFYIFCTSSPQKIIPALQRRAFHITPRLLQDKETIYQIVERSANHANFKEDIHDFVEGLLMHEIFSPGLIIQAAEKYFCRRDVASALSNGKNEIINNIDMVSVCRAIVSGKWSVCAELLKTATKADAYGIRASILGYMKSVLLKSTGTKAINVSKAIRFIVDAQLYDDTTCLPSLLAALCLACAQMNI